MGLEVALADFKNDDGDLSQIQRRLPVPIAIGPATATVKATAFADPVGDPQADGENGRFHRQTGV